MSGERLTSRQQLASELLGRRHLPSRTSRQGTQVQFKHTELNYRSVMKVLLLATNTTNAMNTITPKETGSVYLRLNGNNHNNGWHILMSKIEDLLQIGFCLALVSVPQCLSALIPLCLSASVPNSCLAWGQA